MTIPTSTTPLTRRSALTGATTVGIALPLLAACGSDDASSASATDTETATPSSTATSEATSTAPEATSGAPSGATSAPADVSGIVATTDVPVGSGVILTSPQVVVTQATAGDFKVFSSICTHTGCPVTGISDVISCPCHGSTYDIATGDVLGGPAPSPLPAVAFTVEGDQVVLS